MAPAYDWNGTAYRNLKTGALFETFISGVTMPRYVVTQNFSGAKNVGLNPLVPLTDYAGTITNGIAQINDGAFYQNVRFNCIVDVRSPAIFDNCQFLVPYSYTLAEASIKSAVRVLNGANTQNVLFTNCEIHNRAQRPYNGITGRNFTFRKGVITGVIDGFTDSEAGSAPNTGVGFTVEDSIVPALAAWYSPTINSDIHGSDTHSHSDGHQKNSNLTNTFTNTALFAYIDDIIGTGTPGSGADAGNAYVPSSGYNFIQSQAQMEAWRAARMAYITRADQSFDGISRRLPTAGEGSFAASMWNKAGTLYTHCYFGGGISTVNALDNTLPSSMPGGFVDCTFWNDMVDGPSSRGSNRTVKGNAIATLAGKTFQNFSGNKWWDQTPLTMVDEGGYRIWR